MFCILITYDNAVVVADMRVQRIIILKLSLTIKTREEGSRVVNQEYKRVGLGTGV